MTFRTKEAEQGFAYYHVRRCRRRRRRRKVPISSARKPDPWTHGRREGAGREREEREERSGRREGGGRKGAAGGRGGAGGGRRGAGAEDGEGESGLLLTWSMHQGLCIAWRSFRA